jgi:hypothetical protein
MHRKLGTEKRSRTTEGHREDVMALRATRRVTSNVDMMRRRTPPPGRSQEPAWYDGNTRTGPPDVPLILWGPLRLSTSALWLWIFAINHAVPAGDAQHRICSRVSGPAQSNRLSYSSIDGTPSACALAAHAPELHRWANRGLPPQMSNCCCLPGRAGELPVTLQQTAGQLRPSLLHPI